MTIEEAIGQLTRLRSYCSAEAGTDDRDAATIWKADAEALSIAIAALGAVNALMKRMELIESGQSPAKVAAVHAALVVDRKRAVRTVQKPAQLQSVQGGQG